MVEYNIYAIFIFLYIPRTHACKDLRTVFCHQIMIKKTQIRFVKILFFIAPRLAAIVFSFVPFSSMLAAEDLTTIDIITLSNPITSERPRLLSAIVNGDVSEAKANVEGLKALESLLTLPIENELSVLDPLTVAAVFGQKPIMEVLRKSGASSSQACDTSQRAEAVKAFTESFTVSPSQNNQMQQNALKYYDELRCELLPGVGRWNPEEPDSVLFEAVVQGDLEVVKDLIAEGWSVETREEPYPTISNQARGEEKARARNLLALAIIARQKQMVELLIERGAILDSRSAIVDDLRQWKSYTPLGLAVTLGDESLVSYLLQKGADVNYRNDNGQTPLHIAVAHREHVIISQLLNNGAYPKARNDAGQQPILLAALHNDFPSIELLLKNGANPNALDFDGWSPLLAAVDRNNDNGIINILIKYGADPTIANEKNFNALAASASNGNKRIFEQLVDLVDKKSTVLNRSLKHGNTVIHYAALGGNVGICKIALELGAAVNSQNHKGRTPLMLAANHGVTSLLISQGADLNTLDARGQSAVSHAIIREDRESILVLLRSGANVNAWTDENVADVYKWPQPIVLASEHTDTEIVKSMLDKGADASTVSPSGTTPLMVARNLSVLDLLIDRGVALDTLDERGRSALHHAISRNKPRLIKALLGAGADPNAWIDADIEVFFKEPPPIVLAAEKSTVEILELLVKAGADVNASDYVGNTPLIISVRSEDALAKVRLLLQFGAKRDATDRNGVTAYMTAKGIEEGPVATSKSDKAELMKLLKFD